MEITLFIRGQKLEAHYPPLYSGSVGVLYARFAELDFDKALVKAVRFKTADSDWYTADIIDGAVRVPHEVIVSGGFDIALAGYENADGKLARFLPTNSVHINVEENGYGDPDAPIESEGEPASYTAKIEKLTSDAAAKADAAMAELEKKANAAEVYDKDTADALLGGKVDKVSGKGLSANDYTDEEKAKLAAKADLSFVKKLIPKATVLGDTLEITDHLGDMEAVDYKIYGNSIQESTPTIVSPVEICSVGDKDGEKYNINVSIIADNKTDVIKISLDSQLCGVGEFKDYIDFTNQELIKRTAIKEFDGTENWKRIESGEYEMLYLQIADGVCGKRDELLCTHFPPYDGVWASNNACKKILNSSTNYQQPGFIFMKGSYTVDKWREFLAQQKNAGMSVKVMYPANKKRIPLKSDLAEMKACDMIKVQGATEVPPLIELTYYQDIGKKLAELSA